MNIINIFIWINERWQKTLSFMMIALLKANGAKIGKYSYISFSSRIVGKKIHIGKDVRILNNVKIKASEIYIGDGVVISDNSYITGNGKLHIGYNSYLGKKSRINLSRDVIMGNNVGFGENSVIWTHGYFPPADEGYPVTYAPVTIKDRVWVSTNIIILPGVTIGSDVIVGAGSVITKSVKDSVIIAGNPARIIKNVDEIKKEVDFIKLLLSIMFDFFGDELVVYKEQPLFSWLKFDQVNIFIMEEFCDVVDEANGLVIILCKKINHGMIDTLEKFEWFDFSKKTRKRSNLKLVNDLHDHFRSYGIRFIIE